MAEFRIAFDICWRTPCSVDTPSPLNRPGNFRNLFMYAPDGKKDGIQLIPISEVAAKDDFGSIMNISRDDLLAPCTFIHS